MLENGHFCYLTSIFHYERLRMLSVELMLGGLKWKSATSGTKAEEPLDDSYKKHVVKMLDSYKSPCPTRV